MIFPGMDPYLEDPQLWTGVHASLIVYIRNYLQPLVRPRYVAAIEERVFLEGAEKERIPDVWIQRRKKPQGTVALLESDPPVVVKVPSAEVHQTYVTILDRLSGQKLVTVIEVVSPGNKYKGPGRESYVAKQTETLRSKTHLVEIDLLRTGPHVLAVPEWVARGQGNYHYLSSVNRAQGERDEFDLYARTVRERLPRMAIPLAGNDPDVVLDIQAVLEKTYEDGAYADRINYRVGCQPPLAKEDKTWAAALVKKALRPTGSRRNS